MTRYFIEVSYNGSGYSGFQIQDNAQTIQSEVEKALYIFTQEQMKLTGSSRTDAGVHALQNFFHVDTEKQISQPCIYNLNAILPAGIVVKNIFAVGAETHCRFNATSREYRYYIYQYKNPFLSDLAYYFPYKLNMDILLQVAEMIKGCHDFTSFSKRNTQVKTFLCSIEESSWVFERDCWVYYVKGNRFLRGMVRGLVGTMLRTARGSISTNDFKNIMEAKDCSKVDFSAPPHGLFLTAVNYPEAPEGLCKTLHNMGVLFFLSMLF